jgi:hypothetical protein
VDRSQLFRTNYTVETHDFTVDIDKPSPVTNETLGCLEHIPHGYTQPNLVYDLVGILDVDGILDRLCAFLAEVLGRDLYQIFNRCLCILSVQRLTRMNMMGKVYAHAQASGALGFGGYL